MQQESATTTSELSEEEKKLFSKAELRAIWILDRIKCIFWACVIWLIIINVPGYINRWWGK